MIRRLVVLVLLAAGIVMPATVAAASASPAVGCGQTITTSVVLHTDLTCAGDGLIIGASNVTVRLGGHTIASSDGTGAGIRLGMPQSNPSERFQCLNDVHILDGTVTGFFAAISSNPCMHTQGNRVSSVTLTDNTWGAYLWGSTPLAIDHATIVGANGVGGPVGNTGAIEVTHTRIHVTTTDGYSLLSYLALPSQIDSSHLEGGRVEIVSGQPPLRISNSDLTGVSISCFDSDVTITDTTVAGGGIDHIDACGFKLDGNRFVGPDSGVAANLRSVSYPLVVTNNVFIGWETAVIMGERMTMTGNTFRHNGTAVMSCTGTNPCNGTITANTFVDNRGTGLLLTTGTWHVGSNVARHNGGLGIDAQGTGLTVIDDGGNIAQHNQPPQCIGVVCSAHR